MTTSFKGVSKIGYPELTEITRDNIISFLDWGFLQIGAFYNVSIPQSGSYGGTQHILNPIDDPRYNDGQVWAGYSQNWVWESGISQPTQPVQISGVFVDNTFLPINSGYIVNYPEGKIIFDTPIALNSDVHLEYSYKWVNIIDSDNIPLFREIQYRTFRSDNTNLISGSGDLTSLSGARVQLPVIAVETSVDRDRSGYEIGNSLEWVKTKVILNVLGEDGSSVDRVADILDKQSQKTLFLFDTGKMSEDNAFPLDYNGSIASGAKTYPDLIAPTGDGGYRYTRGVQQGKIRIDESKLQKMNRINNNLYYTTVKWITEVILLQD